MAAKKQDDLPIVELPGNGPPGDAPIDGSAIETPKPPAFEIEVAGEKRSLSLQDVTALLEAKAKLEKDLEARAQELSLLKAQKVPTPPEEPKEPEPEDEALKDLDPEDPRDRVLIATYRSQRALEARIAKSRIEAEDAKESADLEAEFQKILAADPKVNREELFAFALDHSIENLEDAYRLMNYSTLEERARTRERERILRDLEEKRRFAVEAGFNSPGGPPASPPAPKNYQEAVEQAKARLEVA